ncbi:MAG: Ldh family oxidoreductase, partial [Spirochaetaceae bacterium]|nr:Ldh family oxidoreductase [Spirochaetaceae bacterium]
PNAMLDDGSIFFLGGPEYAHKGYGLSLWAEALTAMAGGSCNHPDRDQTQNLNLTVIDIEAFGGSDYFQKEISRFITHMKNTSLRPGYAEIRLPGERSFKNLKNAEHHGLSLDDLKIEMLNNIARKNGVDLLEN